MFRAIGVSLAAIVALSSIPARAQAIDWNVAKDAYQAGQAGENPPTAEEDFAACAAFWSAWSKAVSAGQVPAAAGTVITDDLVAPDAGLYAFGWMLWIENGPDPDASQAAFEEIEPLAREKVAEAVAGDNDAMRGVMGILGSCEMPE